MPFQNPTAKPDHISDFCSPICFLASSCASFFRISSVILSSPSVFPYRPSPLGADWAAPYPPVILPDGADAEPGAGTGDGTGVEGAGAWGGVGAGDAPFAACAAAAAAVLVTAPLPLPPVPLLPPELPLPFGLLLPLFPPVLLPVLPLPFALLPELLPEELPPPEEPDTWLQIAAASPPVTAPPFLWPLGSA